MIFLNVETPNYHHYLSLSISITIYHSLSLSLITYHYLSLSIINYLYLSISIYIYLYLYLSLSIYLSICLYTHTYTLNLFLYSVAMLLSFHCHAPHKGGRRHQGGSPTYYYDNKTAAKNARVQVRLSQVSPPNVQESAWMSCHIVLWHFGLPWFTVKILIPNNSMKLLSWCLLFCTQPARAVVNAQVLQEGVRAGQNATPI